MKKVFAVVCIILATCSCSSLLKESPVSLLSPENFYKTKGDFDFAVVGAYASLFKDYKGFDCPIPLIMTSGAEDLKSYSPIYTNFDLLKATPEEANTIVLMWESLYKAIGNVNGIIGHLPKSAVSDTDKNEIEGQAKFLRAFCYFYLTRWFGEVQLVVYENQTKVANLKQATVAEIYALIVEDLKAAESKLPESFTGEPGRANKWSAKTLLAKVYLTMAGYPLNRSENYALARDKAKEVMTANIYKLEPHFADLWKHDNRFNKEFIFAFYGSIASGGVSGTLLDKPTAPGLYKGKGWGDLFSEMRFYKAFPEGARKDATFIFTFPDGTTAKSNGVDPYIAKYQDAGPVLSSNRGEGTMVILRYADVLLMYAEATNMAEGSPSADALEALNKVRRRAKDLPVNTPDTTVDLPSSTNSIDFDKAVIAERNWELAGEGNRWFDLVRRKMVVSANTDRKEIINPTEDDALLPKPLGQLIPNLVLQNKGY